MRFTSIIQRGWALFATLLLLGTTGFAFPQAEGSSGAIERIRGLAGPITIMRDRDGVPLIRATTERDLHYGLGYVHAEDRLWQMEFQRQLASGRLAELIGPAGVNADRLFRTVGLRRAAEGNWQGLTPDERQPFEAYAAGVNAYLADRRPEQLPPEYAILQIAPEPWTPIDTLTFVKLFTFDNGSGWEKELLRGALIPRLGAETVAQLMPAYTDDGPTIVEGSQTGRHGDRETKATGNRTVHDLVSLADEQTAALLDLHRSVLQQTGVGADVRGSNGWVLSGARTRSGKPILANDPHLSAQTPAFWYLAHLRSPGFTAIGATVPALPGVQIGHNGAIAWGVTTINADSQDLYVEQINERGEALYGGAWEPLKIVTETIKVKGQPDITLNVRSTRHGPLLSDAVNPAGPALALRWTGHDPDDRIILSALAVNRARNWREFTGALREYRGPNMNYLYADRAGNIGYVAGTTIPIRPKGDGSVPVPGWTGEYEWQGYVPFERLPQVFNPPGGYIASSNNRVTNDPAAPLIGTHFAAPYRASRVIELIEATPRHSADDAAAMQADVLAVHARELLPILLRTPATDERAQQALDLLRHWDARVAGDSAAAAIFEAWYIRLGERLFADELGELWPSYGVNLNMVGMAIDHALQSDAALCDDVRTADRETCAAVLADSLQAGLADMSAAQGSENVAEWRWDRAHRARFPHQPLDGNPQLQPTFSRSIANGGDRFTVNVAASYKRWEDYDQYHAASYRQIVDWGEGRDSRWIVAPGQSGDPASPHYDDLLEQWQRVDYLPMRVRVPAK
jgi:penicillin G amidase